MIKVEIFFCLIEFAKLATKYPGVVFVKVDLCVNKEFGQAHRVTHIPAFILFHNKDEVDRMVGCDMNLLKEKIGNQSSQIRSERLVDPRGCDTSSDSDCDFSEF